MRRGGGGGGVQSSLCSLPGEKKREIHFPRQSGKTTRNSEIQVPNFTFQISNPRENIFFTFLGMKLIT